LDLQMTSTHFLEAPIESVGTALLFRAIVSLPPELAGGKTLRPERIVFFEAPDDNTADTYLEELLAKMWGIDTTGWVESYFIHSVFSVAELRCMATSSAPANDLQLFELGNGGHESTVITSEHIRYARSSQVDLFVSPQVSIRLRDALDTIDALYMTKASAPVR
jgi:hypothetical protein